MQSLINSMREIIGNPQFYLSDGSWDYGSMIEYIGALLLVLIVVSSVFKLILNLSK